jgi:hypothetical protein
VTLNIVEPSVLPASEKPEVNVPNAEPILTNMTESQNGNSANSAVNYSEDVQQPNTPDNQGSKPQESQDPLAQETNIQENTIVLLAQLKEGQT